MLEPSHGQNKSKGPVKYNNLFRMDASSCTQKFDSTAHDRRAKDNYVGLGVAGTPRKWAFLMIARNVGANLVQMVGADL